ncbi:MAG: hypothetical protein J7507_13310 [Pseudoxanthomonas sp.]|nr:hypothetical protein [Pseudoxanthomonas sp.]
MTRDQKSACFPHPIETRWPRAFPADQVDAFPPGASAIVAADDDEKKIARGC